MNSTKIQRGFSASAKNYDRFSGLHREIADRLIGDVYQKIDRRRQLILDVGCGTGYLTGRLKEHFPQSKVIGLDFSPEMLEVARSGHEGIDWILGNGHSLPFSDGNFDILASNLAYQWAGDLSRAFSEARRVLAPNGVLACTLFGYHTCQELFQSLDEAKPHTFQFTRLPDEAHVAQALATSGFRNPEIKIERIKIEFNGMHELISWLKSIGANHLPREGYLGPEAMSQAASVYRRKFSYLQGVGATFEVVRVYVKS